jgi:GNAT superfamily N-acetyltransferase
MGSAGMGGSGAGRLEWAIAAEHVGSGAAAELLREFYTDVSDRYLLLHHGRRSTPREIDCGLAAEPSDDLAPPTGLFLIGRRGGLPGGCVGLRLPRPGVAELTRFFVRHPSRGTGGGRALLAAAEHAARGLGAVRIELDTRLDLVEARALYARHGYAQIPAIDDRAHAEIWYAKGLPHRPA